MDALFQFTHPIFWIAVICILIPMMMTISNQLIFGPPPVADFPEDEEPEISILIPARDEEANIERIVRSSLEAEEADIEVIVLDDHSTDRTPEIVKQIAKEDPRVRLELAPELPPGLCGKFHACARLAEHATKDLMLFVDADVTMRSDAPARLAMFMKQQDASLVSAFPTQITGTFLEKLLIPLIEFVLLGFLPIEMGRKSKSPGFGAGCGQVMLARKKAYNDAGGHDAITHTLHDGLFLPRNFRKAGYHTDICSGEGMIFCRMYTNAKDVWNGLLKNAHQGVGSPTNIFPFTFLLVGGSILPFLLLIPALLKVPGFPIALIIGLCLVAYLPRFLNTIRFGQSWLGFVLHPLSMALFLIIQWQGLIRMILGKKPSWKGRSIG